MSPSTGRPRIVAWIRRSPRAVAAMAGALLNMLAPASAFAHAMAPGDKGFIMCSSGVMLMPFIYLGAKHMVTGYDHLLFLLAVIFFLYRLRDIGLYVTLFAIGHSVTLLVGVVAEVRVNPFLIDAIIGFSVIYKGMDNLGFFERVIGVQPNARVATLIFGLFHGMGLATRILDYDVDPDGLIPNLIGFNIGVELGQLIALGAMLIVMGYWRRTASFTKHAHAANVVISLAGVLLVARQIVGFMTSSAT